MEKALQGIFWINTKLKQIEKACGCICLGVLFTVMISNAMLLKAFLPEVPIMVDSLCCAGVTPESHERALEAMKACQIEVL